MEYHLLILLFNLMKESHRVWKTSHPGSVYAEVVLGRGCGGPGGGQPWAAGQGVLPQGASAQSDQGLLGPGRVEVSTA